MSGMIEISGRWAGEGGTVLAEAVDGDFAFQLVRNRTRPMVVHTAFAQHVSGKWRYKGGGVLPSMGWVNDGTDPHLGVVGVGGPSSSLNVVIEFRGEEFTVPVIGGYFAWIRRDVPSHVYPDKVRY
jgi:hypothetical protein